MTNEMAWSIALVAGWLAVVVALVWEAPHCQCCVKRQRPSGRRSQK